MNKLEQLRERGIGYNEPVKAAFKKEVMRLLRAIARAAGLNKDEYRCSYNDGGIAVSGEGTLHTPTRYIQVSDSCIGRGVTVLVRSCDGLKDYCGHTNHFVSSDRLYDAKAFADTVLNDGPLQLHRAA